MGIAGNRIGILLAALLASTGLAQIPPGHGVVAWRPQGGTAPGGIVLVDPAGNVSQLAGLDPATTGRSGLDGTRSLLAAQSGFLYAGLGVDNRGGTAPAPLTVRLILVQGATVSVDRHFSTLMNVPAGEVWHVSDLKQRPDGSLLAAVTQVLFTANPMPATAVFAIDSVGNAASLPLPGIPGGSLLAIADAGDRMVLAFLQSFFVVNAELWSQPFPGGSGQGWRVCQFVSVGGVGGLELDADGTLMAAVGVRTAAGAATVHRIPHAPGATPVPVAGTPASLSAAHLVPGPGLAVQCGTGTTAGDLAIVDTLAGGTKPWAKITFQEPAAIAVRGNPGLYGPASPAGPVRPWLGSRGGFPARGNAAFGFRAGGTPGAAGVLLLGRGKTSIATPFGTLLVDPAGGLFPLAGYVVPAAGAVDLPLPLPAGPGLAGFAAALQAVQVAGAAPPAIEMSPGLWLHLP